MSESARHTIPRRLDDPERWLFWTVDEAAALMGPALLGLAANQFVPGLIAGVGGWLVLRRVKRGGGANIARYALYWFLPDFVLRLKATPAEPSPALRRLRRERCGARTWRARSAGCGISAWRWRLCWRCR